MAARVPSRTRDLTIGEAVARLVPQFPGLTVAAVRRLEADGRFVATRTATGYRRYSESDLEQLRIVLSFSGETPPPSVPRPARPPEAVRAADPAPAAAAPAPEREAPREPAWTAQPPAPAGARAAAQPGPAPVRRAARRWPEAEFFAPDLGEVRFDRDQLAATLRTERSWIDELVDFGLLPDRERFGGEQLLVARACAELAGSGLEPRHLRVVAAGAARAAELVTVAVGGTGPGRAARAAETAAAAVRLHAALVRAALVQAGGLL
jgi:hypothetical protein